ncbi:uncharacterized protein LOC123263579 [Cotesia glomerata]|uniref:uncharacterized protein LOC123263579 n=1 Tax=Cotesia glomerata TaxID=32391 RepID=UPI001D014707|nr:uncharacterized protein LOC123263579 [Cotesia glomerata]
MSEENKDEKNVLFTFEHVFTKIANSTGKMKSPEFETPKIPGVKFSITACILYHNTVDVEVKKNDIRKAVSIIKIYFGGSNSTRRVVNWKDRLCFETLNIPFDFDVCDKYINLPNFCCQKDIGHEYTVPITCEIIWNGFVEDLYYSDVSTQMKILYDDKELTDMLIKIEDGEFPAHRSIISAQSPVFYKMLTSGMKESKENSITFPDTDTDVIKELLLFIYKGKMDKAETDAELALKLCNFAHMYQIDQLKITCEYILIRSLTIENAPAILAAGKIMESVILQQQASAFITLNISAMLAILMI